MKLVASSAFAVALVVPAFGCRGAKPVEARPDASSDAAMSVAVATDAESDAPSDAELALAPHPAPPRAPALAEMSIPARRSPAPAHVEWQHGDPVELDTDPEIDCAAVLLREWLRVRCGGLIGSVAIVSGSADGVTATFDEHDPLLLAIAVRRGDRRVIQITSVQFEGYGGAGTAFQAPGLFLSESWIDGVPRVTLHRASSFRGM